MAKLVHIDAERSPSRRPLAYRGLTAHRTTRGEDPPMAKRFVPLSEVCEVLDISSAQAYALVRSGELPAIKVGGRGQWRVETAELESYIQRMYARTAEMVRSGDLDDD
jgi:excisionase family DNA binding protein